jgi:hypothetical protein
MIVKITVPSMNGTIYYRLQMVWEVIITNHSNMISYIDCLLVRKIVTFVLSVEVLFRNLTNVCRAAQFVVIQQITTVVKAVTGKIVTPVTHYEKIH